MGAHLPLADVKSSYGTAVIQRSIVGREYSRCIGSARREWNAQDGEVRLLENPPHKYMESKCKT